MPEKDQKRQRADLFGVSGKHVKGYEDFREVAVTERVAPLFVGHEFWRYYDIEGPREEMPEATDIIIDLEEGKPVRIPSGEELITFAMYYTGSLEATPFYCLKGEVKKVIAKAERVGYQVASWEQKRIKSLLEESPKTS